jgi:hypothetical protein
MSAEDKLKAMGLALSATPKPLANYISYKKIGDLVFLSGQDPQFGQGEGRPRAALIEPRRPDDAT